MNIESFSFVKIIIFFVLIVFGVNSFIQGFSSLNDFNQKISFVKPIEIPKNDFVEKEKTKLIDNKKIDKKKSIPIKKEEVLNEKLIIVKKNDTFSKIIRPFFNIQQENLIIQNISKKFDLKYLSIGQKIYLYENKKNQIVKMILPISFKKDLILHINQNSISLHEENIEIEKDVNSLKFTISSSLYQDGIKAGLPLAVLAEAIRLYSFDIDFQRDIKKDTIFEILYETLINVKRNTIEYGDIEYINLKIENKDLEYFIFFTEDGYIDYFDREGKNVKKSLLKTPIDGARLSSNFGMRKHPISGYNKLHKGVDFAAPIGTPVYAGGNGVVEFVGRNGGYGKYIRIRHNNEYKTAYAHLSGYNKKIYKGARVNQGEIIGFVGNTGNSTGPHLHYEIIYQNKQINPMKLKLPSGKVLEGSELEKFKKNMKDIYARHLYALYE